MLIKILLFVLLSSIFILRRILFNDKMTTLLPYWMLLGLSGLSLKILFRVAPMDTYTGQFGRDVSIYIIGVLALIVLFDQRKNGTSKNKYWKVSLFFSFYCMLSFFNPNNIHPSFIWVPFSFFFQLFLFVIVVRRRYSNQLLLSSLYEAIACWLILEFLLVLCYPILGIEGFATLFHGEDAAEWSMRRDYFLSAVGTFIHPAGLAYVCSCYAIFFFSLFFARYRRNESLLYFLLCLIVVFFTFSRTSYVALFLSLFVVYFMCKTNPRHVKKRLIKYGVVAFLLFVLLLYVPILNELFFQSDAEDQVGNRMIHYIMGWDIFNNFPLLGTGINRHVNYMYDYTDIKFLTGRENVFFLRSPIHNSHLIVLVETGLIGFICFFSSLLFFLKNQIKFFYSFRGYYISSVIIIGVILFSFIYGFFGWSIYQYEIFTPIAFLICFVLYNNDYKVKIPQ